MAKYCVIPGQPAVRLDSLDGHIIIISEEPREIPEQFISKAKAAGCLSEEELMELTQRLLGGSKPALTDSNSKPSQLADIDENDWPPLPGDTKINDERTEKIKSAMIELLNAGDQGDLSTLIEKLGFEITQEERDAAYDAAQG